jgi:hypothetical protein
MRIIDRLLGRSAEEETEEEEEEESEYPKEFHDTVRITGTVKRTHGKVHYPDGSTEDIVYDMRHDEGNTVEIEKHDIKNDARVYVSPRSSLEGPKKPCIQFRSPTGDTTTYSVPNFEKITVSYEDTFIVYADVDVKVEVTNDNGAERYYVFLEEDREDIDYSFMIDYEYEELRRREEDPDSDATTS